MILKHNIITSLFSFDLKVDWQDFGFYTKITQQKKVVQIFLYRWAVIIKEDNNFQIK